MTMVSAKGATFKGRNGFGFYNKGIRFLESNNVEVQSTIGGTKDGAHNNTLINPAKHDIYKVASLINSIVVSFEDNNDPIVFD
ncbi:MAG: hypothetical protein MI784_16385, partial [Cytophagales bacterium]|nr:hypothetical protein [Cytophagales bacterium]